MQGIIEFAREPLFLAVTGQKRSTGRDYVKKGLLPPPVKIGLRSSAWILAELHEVNKARVAGQSEEQIRALVTSLVAKRQQTGSMAA